MSPVCRISKRYLKNCVHFFAGHNVSEHFVSPMEEAE